MAINIAFDYSYNPMYDPVYDPMYSPTYGPTYGRRYLLWALPMAALASSTDAIYSEQGSNSSESHSMCYLLKGF